MVLRESADIVRMAPGVVISRTRHGFVLANAGVDASNAGGEGRLVALPKDPDGSARRLRQDFLDRTGKNVAVIISDTFGRTWRVGQTDLAVGVAGLSPLRDYRGEKDADGRAMSRTCLAHADELASAAELVRGKAEGIPIRSFGHAGDGNLHIYCCANDMELDEFKRRSKAVMDKCYAKCIEFGGQVSGEHAIGHAKKQYLVESAGETAFGLMQAIKQVFDPKCILNPGKVCTNVEEG